MADDVTKLERFWSPIPIYAYKYYEYRKKLFLGWDDSIFKAQQEYEYECRIPDPQWQGKCDDNNHPGQFSIIETVCDGFLEGHRVVLKCGCAFRHSVGPSCGFYARKFDTENELRLKLSQHRTTIALVELSGLVVEHSRGYRAQKQTILDHITSNSFERRIRRLLQWRREVGYGRNW